MKKILLLTLLFLFFSVSLFAQLKEPERIDEFGKTNSEDLQAKFENYAIQLLSNTNSILQILIHRSEKQLLGSPYRFAAKIKTFLIKYGIEENRIIAANCQAESEESVQVWLLNDKTQQQTCQNDSTKLENTTLFDSAYYSNPEFGSCCIVDEFREQEASGSLNAFAETLKKYPDSKAYVFIYLGTNIYWSASPNGREKPIRKLDSSNISSAMSQNARKILTENGIDSSRIILKYGGYKDSTRNVEMWVVPKNSEIPTPKPNYFPKKAPRKKV